jgi:hypothetical protein
MTDLQKQREKSQLVIRKWDRNSFYISLHTNKQTLNPHDHEADYDGYNSIAIPRGKEFWSVNKSEAINYKNVTFPTCTGGTCYVYSFAVSAFIGNRLTILFSSHLSSGLQIQKHITPEFSIGSIVLTMEGIDLSQLFL